MKILWFCNVMLPRIAKSLSINEAFFAGWLAGLSEGLLKDPDIELSVAFPMSGASSVISGDCGPGDAMTGTLKYYAFPQRKSDINKYGKETEAYAEKIMSSVNPDVVHIFGTEFPHTLAIVNACEKLGMTSRVLINVQGLVSIYAGHYYAGLPNKVVGGYTLRDAIKRDNIRHGRNVFIKRGKYEIEALRKVRHISGRTDWDKACASQINPNAQYHFCFETLRDEFYKHNWDIAQCERNSIFLSQAHYPIKGLHFVLEALPEIIRRFPDTHLYIAGPDITKEGAPLTQSLKITYYGVYIKRLIDKYQLRKHIIFAGMLDEKAMCDRFLKTHVFVSPSSVENESNSVSEAKILGVPVVASFVGGVTERLKHHETGFYYQHDAPYMLAHYVCSIFGDDNLALRFSRNAKIHAQKIHNREKNVETMAEIYRAIRNEDC